VKSFRHLSKKTEGFKPVKEFIFKEYLNLIVISKFNTALQQMADPIQASVTNVAGKMMVKQRTLGSAGKRI
jgi:hypothetical protein